MLRGRQETVTCRGRQQIGDRFSNIFSSKTKNGDGYLSWEEFTSHADLEDKQEVKDAIELFKAADANGDGKVSKDEFIKLMSKCLKVFLRKTYVNLSHIIWAIFTIINSAETIGGE